MNYTLSNECIENYNESTRIDFPKYTSQIINLANQNAQGTRPAVVGQMTELFQKFMETDIEKTIDEWEKWRNELYHTIGNFTPVPWPIMKYGSINMQDIHKGLDERWDLFLKLCQSEWTYFKKYSIYIDFQSYIKLTCQEIYFVEIYDLFNDKFGTQSIGDLSNEELLSWYDAISTIDLSNKKIVTFGNDLTNDVRNINRLITIRGRLMIALAKKNRQ